MKSIFCFLGLLASITGFSQKCKNYYFLQNNKTIEMTILNKKGEPNGKQVYAVTKVNSSGDNITATVNSEFFDKSGKSLFKAANVIQCNAGVMMMDMKMSLPQAQASQIKDPTATASNVYIEYPADMKEGDNLKDATMQVDIENNGMKQSVNMQVINRKVQGKENITTPAGSWECFKITNTTKMKVKTMGIGIPVNSDVTEWFAPGFGIVKSESKGGGTIISAIH
jgi:hypothetical protein